jgi:hypothetical protein
MIRSAVVLLRPFENSIYLPLVLMELHSPEFKWVTTVQHKKMGLINTAP